MPGPSASPGQTNPMMGPSCIQPKSFRSWICCSAHVSEAGQRTGLGWLRRLGCGGQLGLEGGHGAVQAGKQRVLVGQQQLNASQQREGFER